MKPYVEGKSREDLRHLALQLRSNFHLENQLYFPAVEMLDVFEEIDDSFSYVVLPDFEMLSNEHAHTDVLEGEIRIKESIYDGACNGNGRDRMTIAHELSHYLMLCRWGFKLYWMNDDSRVESYCDPEWQAKCLAGEIMVAHNLVQGLSPEEIARQCGVSLAAARYQKQVA